MLIQFLDVLQDLIFTHKNKETACITWTEFQFTYMCRIVLMIIVQGEQALPVGFPIIMD